MPDLDRESVLRQRIAEAAARHRAAYVDEVSAWVDELASIEARKPTIVYLGANGPVDVPRPLWMERSSLPERSNA